MELLLINCFNTFSLPSESPWQWHQAISSRGVPWEGLFSTKHVDLGIVTTPNIAHSKLKVIIPGREDNRFSLRAKVRSFFKLQTSLGS